MVVSKKRQEREAFFASLYAGVDHDDLCEKARRCSSYLDLPMRSAEFIDGIPLGDIGTTLMMLQFFCYDEYSARRS